jgi:dephospho-CoA kinase
VLRVGLTGGLASGKSTVGRMLRDRGAAVFDADAIVRELYAPGGEGERAAREIFGEEIADASGGVSRAKIAAIVFADPQRRHLLESRIHPLVQAERARRFAEAERQGAAVAVAEASQLFEARTEGDYDRVLLVVAPEESRLRRWEAAGGDPADARRRIESQARPSEVFDRADDVIVNDGTLENLARKVEEVWRRWVAGAPREAAKLGP